VLAAWFRLKYPHIVLGSLASSAPILYFDGISPEVGYYSIVTKDFKVTHQLFYILRSYVKLCLKPSKTYSNYCDGRCRKLVKVALKPSKNHGLKLIELLPDLMVFQHLARDLILAGN
jgi:hypothetical protein